MAKKQRIEVEILESRLKLLHNLSSKPKRGVVLDLGEEDSYTSQICQTARALAEVRNQNASLDQLCVELQELTRRVKRKDRKKHAQHG
jgi:hypothetical protein